MSSKKNKNKTYGESVLYPLAQKDLKDDRVFEKMATEISQNDLQELKTSSMGTVRTKVITDAISGLNIETKLNDESNEDTSIHDIINKKEVEGKILSLSGIKILEDLLGTVPDALISKLENSFESIPSLNDINVMTTSEIEKVFGDDICNSVKNKIFSSDNYPDVIRRFFEQLYESYIYKVQFNDDIQALNKVTQLISSVDKVDTQVSSDIQGDTLQDSMKKIEEALSLVSNVKSDKHRAKYTIDDLECNMLEELRVDLLNALQLTKMYETAKMSGGKFKKDMKKINKIKQKVTTWISQIRSDEDTVYTFPIIEDFGIVDMSNVADNFIHFLVNVILTEKLASINIDVNELDDYDDIEKYYADKAKVSKAELAKMYEISTLFAYLLCRSYKIKDISTASDRRVLSYALDMVSKSNYRSYRPAVVKHMIDLYNIVISNKE